MNTGSKMKTVWPLVVFMSFTKCDHATSSIDAMDAAKSVGEFTESCFTEIIVKMSDKYPMVTQMKIKWRIFFRINISLLSQV